MVNSSNIPIKNKNKIAVELKISFKIFILTVLVTILFIISLLIYDGYFKIQFGEESDVVDKFNELTNYAYSCEGCLLETLSASEIKDYVTSKILEEDFEVAIIFFGITFISIMFLRYFVKLIKWVKENS